MKYSYYSCTNPHPKSNLIISILISIYLIDIILGICHWKNGYQKLSSSFCREKVVTCSWWGGQKKLSKKTWVWWIEQNHEPPTNNQIFLKTYLLVLATKARIDIVFRITIEYSSLRDFGPYVIDLFLYEDFWKMMINWLVLRLEISYRVIISWRIFGFF